MASEGVRSGFAEALDLAIERSGLPLSRIRTLLRRSGHEVSVATLSYWRRGLVQPQRATSRAVVVALESVLQVPTGALASTLDERIDPAGCGGDVMQEMADAMGLSWDDDLMRAGLTNVVTYGDVGGRMSCRVSETVVARRDGIDRFLVGLWSDELGADTVFEALGNCRLGRQMRTRQGLVAEIVLPRPLAAGERWTAEYRTVARIGAEGEPGWGRCLLTPTGFLHFTVIFAAGWAPRHAELVVTGRGRITRTPMTVQGDRISVLVRDVGPGDVDLLWKEPETPTGTA